MVVQEGVPFKEVSDAERRKAARAEGPATVLGIGTALPPNVYEQSEYPDFFFAVTNCDHKVELKEKFRRICQKTGIQRRYMYLDKELLQANPGMATYMEPSLNSRQEIAIREVPKLAAQASLKAIKEWGRPKSEITHVVMGTTSGVCMPGAEVSLIKLLGLNPSTRRIMMYQQGCFAGATVTRVAKDLAENNAGARVLAVTSELTVVTFRAPSEEHLDGLVGSALFGDGAAALIVGADPLLGIERPIFELHWSGETLLPDSEGAIEGRLMEAGLVFHLMRDVPTLIAKNIEKVLSGAVTKAGLNHRNNSNVIASAAPAPEAISWDDMFWVVHPGGPAILDQVEKKLKLSSEKLATTRQVLADYGNMSSCSVLFALDHIRHRSKQLGASTSGEGLKWGFLIAFGPGLTFEATLLKSCLI